MNEHQLPNEAALASEVLTQIKNTAPNKATRKVVEAIRLKILAQPRRYEELIYGGMPPSQFYYTEMANISADYLESGQFHISRGILDNVGIEMLEVFDTAIDVLAQMNVVSKDDAAEQKRLLRVSIKIMG